MYFIAFYSVVVDSFYNYKAVLKEFTTHLGLFYDTVYFSL